MLPKLRLLLVANLVPCDCCSADLESKCVNRGPRWTIGCLVLRKKRSAFRDTKLACLSALHVYWTALSTLL